jgi:hypothetical protein
VQCFRGVTALADVIGFKPKVMLAIKYYQTAEDKSMQRYALGQELIKRGMAKDGKKT